MSSTLVSCVAQYFFHSESTAVPRFMLHQCEATPLGIIGVRGIRILMWVKAGDVDQRIALVGELERMVIARVLLKALEVRIDGWMLFFTVFCRLNE